MMDQNKKKYQLLTKNSVMFSSTIIILMLMPILDAARDKGSNNCKDYSFSITCSGSQLQNEKQRIEYECIYYTIYKDNQRAFKYCIRPEFIPTSSKSIRCIPDYEEICTVLYKSNGTEVKEYTQTKKDIPRAHYYCIKTLSGSYTSFSTPKTRLRRETNINHCVYESNDVLPEEEGTYHQKSERSGNNQLPKLKEKSAYYVHGEIQSLSCISGKFVYPLIIRQYVDTYDIYFESNVDRNFSQTDPVAKLDKRCIKMGEICDFLISLGYIKGAYRAVQDVDAKYKKCLNESQRGSIKEFEMRMSSNESSISISEDFANATSFMALGRKDLMAAVNISKQLSKRMTNNFRRDLIISNTEKKENANKLLSDVLTIGSNLLNDVNRETWMNLGEADRKEAATSLLVGIEQTAFFLAESIYQQDIVEIKDNKILMSVRVLNSSNVENQSFLPASSKEKWSTYGDSIHLPKEAFVDFNENGLVRIVFTIFDHLQEVMQPQITSDLSDYPKSLSTVEDIQEMPDNSERTNDMDRNNSIIKVINSNVIAASINDLKRNRLRKPVSFTVQHLRRDVNNPSCVFWDEKLRVWSSDGCVVKWTNATHTSCECSHLTNFAVLMDLNAVPLSTADALALHLITVIGCTISVLALFGAVVIFHFFKGMNSDRTTIHKNLCACLLVAEVIFLFGINQTSNTVLCGFIAAFLHYFFLAAFVWMFLEGFQLYAMLIEVFEPEYARTHWYYLVAYITPLIIVGVSALVDHTSYGTSQICWLRSDNYFILSFILPVAVILLANWSSLFMVVYIMCHHSSVMNTSDNSKRMKVWLRSSILLAVLLGLTWTFGLLYLNEHTIFMAYVFSILNSLQGLFIFIFHCLLNEMFQSEFRRFGRRQNWLSHCAGLTSEPTSMTTKGLSTAPLSKLSAQSSMSLNYGSSFGSGDRVRKTEMAARSHEVIYAERFILDHKPSPSQSANQNVAIDCLDILDEDKSFSDENAATIANSDVPVADMKLQKTSVDFHRVPEPEEISETENEYAVYDIPKAQPYLIPIENALHNKDFDRPKTENEEPIENENEYAVYKTDEAYQVPKKVVTFKTDNECDKDEECETENEYAVHKVKNLSNRRGKKIFQMENENEACNAQSSSRVLENDNIYKTENEYAVYNAEFNHHILDKENEFETENEYAVYKTDNHPIHRRKQNISENKNKESSRHIPSELDEYETENEYTVYKTDNHPVPQKKETVSTKNEYSVCNIGFTHQVPSDEDLYECENEYAEYKTD